MVSINYLDLFSGCGGFHLGLERAGFKFDWVGHSEVDKYACQVYHNHLKGECLGDIKAIKPDTLPKMDIVTFGFPCQDLSVAGKQRGLHGARSGLFFEALRIIEATRPKVFIFENVKGLLSSSEGRDFETVLRAVADIGLYDCEWQLVNTRWFLPQNRERIYFIGHLRGRSRPKVFPFREGDGEHKGRQGVVANALDANYFKGPSNGFGGKSRTLIPVGNADTKGHIGLRQAEGVNRPSRGYEPRNDGNSCTIKAGESGSKNLIQVGNVDTKGHNSIWGRVYSPKGDSATITDGGGMGAKTGLYEVTHENKSGIQTAHPYASALRSGASHNYQRVSNIRRLTPTECARLQGFPDDWHKGLSDTQAYKIYGNAVTVDVVKAIGERLRCAMTPKK